MLDSFYHITIALKSSFLLRKRLTFIFMPGSESFVRAGPTLTTSFLVDDDREDPTTTKRGPTSARQRADNGRTLNAGLVAL